MTELLGVIIIVGQIRGAIIVFGGHKQCPKWLRIIIGICMIFFFIGFYGAVNGH